MTCPCLWLCLLVCDNNYLKHTPFRLTRWSQNYLVCSISSPEISSWPGLQQASDSDCRKHSLCDFLCQGLEVSLWFPLSGVGSLQPDDKVECLVTGLPPCRWWIQSWWGPCNDGHDNIDIKGWWVWSEKHYLSLPRFTVGPRGSSLVKVSIFFWENAWSLIKV